MMSNDSVNAPLLLNHAMGSGLVRWVTLELTHYPYSLQLDSMLSFWMS